MTEADIQRRLRTVTPGDPVADYFGFPDIQRDLLDGDERMGGFVDQVVVAAERIRDLVPVTALDLSPQLSTEVGCDVLLKRDDTTQVRTFKLRGAANKVLNIPEDERKKGVIAASAGNHAQGVAYTGQLLDMPVTIVMPTTTPDQKVRAVKGFGANVVLYGDSYSDAYEHSMAVMEETGSTYVHPFDDEDVIVGQATVALEILEQRPDVTHIFVPVGGGGLLAGIVQLVKEVAPHVQVIGVEPTDSSMMTQSLEANEVLEAPHVGGFADGVAVKRVGAKTFEAAKLADGMVTVNDDDICVALANFVLESHSTLEPAGALGISGLKQYAAQGLLPPESVAVAICSGANIDNSRLLHVLSRAEKAADRNMLLRIALPEQPGALRQLCERVITGHNITQFSYRKNSSQETAHITIGLRIRGEEDKTKLHTMLDESEYSFADLSENPVIKEHGTQSSGNPPNTSIESFYAIEFADRPGALLELLRGLGDRWNISMFQYGGSEGDTGRVVIGFEDAEKETLEVVLKEHTNHYGRADSDVELMYG